MIVIEEIYFDYTGTNELGELSGRVAARLEFINELKKYSECIPSNTKNRGYGSNYSYRTTEDVWFYLEFKYAHLFRKPCKTRYDDNLRRSPF